MNCRALWEYAQKCYFPPLLNDLTYEQIAHVKAELKWVKKVAGSVKPVGMCNPVLFFFLLIHHISLINNCSKTDLSMLKGSEVMKKAEDHCMYWKWSYDLRAVLKDEHGSIVVEFTTNSAEVCVTILKISAFFFNHFWLV